MSAAFPQTASPEQSQMNISVQRKDGTTKRDTAAHREERRQHHGNEYDTAH